MYLNEGVDIEFSAHDTHNWKIGKLNNSKVLESNTVKESKQE